MPNDAVDRLPFYLEREYVMSAPAAATMQDLRASASTIDCFQDENASSSSSFSQMTQAFSQRIAELQQLVCFRVEGVSASSCSTLLLAAVGALC